jgi:hypothetical protein
MDAKKWQQLFDLIQELVDQPQPFQDKKAEVMAQADLHHATTKLDDFVGWFGGLLEEI